MHNTNINTNNNSLEPIYYGKKEIMEIFHCESDKALRLLRLLFQMREANKIGREYYVSKQALENFMNDMKARKFISDASHPLR